MSIGVSDYYLKNNTIDAGNSYTTLTPGQLSNLVASVFGQRFPGTGEYGLDRKVLVPLPINEFVPPQFFCPARVKLALGMNVRAEVVERQKWEAPFVEVFVTPEDAKKFGLVETPAKTVHAVCYSAEALLENGGTRTTDREWEIVTLLCSTGEMERMPPLTMARNQLEMVGGTKPEAPYTSDEWARAVWESHNRGIKVRAPKHAK